MLNRLKASSAIAILLLGVSAAGQQADRAQTEALARRAADRLNALHEEADRLASQERTLLGDLRRLEIDREIKTEELRQLEQDAAKLTRDLAGLDTQVAALEQQNQLDAPRLRERIISLYKLGQGRYARLLLSTSEIRHIGQAARLVAAMAGQDQQRVADYQRSLDELTRSRTTLQEQRRQLGALRAGASGAKAAADEAVRARNALIDDIDRRRDLNAQFAGELLTAQQRLQATLTGLASGAAAVPAALPIGPFRGDLEWPVAGAIRQAFGQASRSAGTAANGIDIQAAEGTSVHAVHEGSVAFADAMAGFGQLVIVDHGGRTFSLYGNLRETVVVQGARVARGDLVGTAGVSPSGAAGLYFELRIDGRPVDPLQWLKKR